MSDLTPSRPGFRAGYVAFAGRPNVGKSTLMNRILGQKLAIVSPRPQTTRQRIMGIWTDEMHQVIFLDTPGLLEPKLRLHESMLRAARSAIQDADVVVAMHDVTRPLEEFTTAIEIMAGAPGTRIVVLNKIDRVGKDTLLPIIGALSEADAEVDIVPVSALDGDNVDRLLDLLKAALPESPAYYPADVLTEHPERFFAAEIIREQILLQFRDEVPHSVQVEIERFEEAPGRKDEIDAVIHVERATHKGILIGDKGSAIKKVGIAARHAIEEFLDRPIVLKLFVKVAPRWRQDPRALRRLGFDT